MEVGSHYGGGSTRSDLVPFDFAVARSGRFGPRKSFLVSLIIPELLRLN